MWQISAADVDTLTTGASLLGAGGGGDVRLLAALLRRVLAEQGPVTVMDFDELPPAGNVVPVGGVGSVTLFEEKPMAGDELVRAVDKVSRHTDTSADAVACNVAAGVLLLFPVLAAAQLRLPLLDADPVRRGVPRLDQSLLTLAGVPLTPLALSDATGGTLIVEGLDNDGTERTIRATIAALGGWACYAIRPLSMAEARSAMVPGSVRAAFDLGRSFRSGDYRKLAAEHRVRTLFHGKVTEVRRAVDVASGSAATVVIEHAEEAGRVLRLEMQSEYLLAVEDGELLASVPDLICLVEHDSANCLSTERLRYGLWVRVIALPCLPQWRTPVGLELMGPRAFGYDLDYVPLEETPVADSPSAGTPTGG